MTILGTLLNIEKKEKISYICKGYPLGCDALTFISVVFFNLTIDSSVVSFFKGEDLV